MSYKIYKNIIPVTSSNIRDLKKLIQEKGETIFNPDYKRIQVPIPVEKKIHSDIIRVISQKGISRGRIPNDMYVLFSKAGCMKQPYHYDYSPSLDQTKMRKKPGGLLIALQNNTKFSLVDKDIVLNKGDCIFFEGDCPHAGASFEKDNIRIHIYLDVLEFKRMKNTTWYY
jgi:hypothetical protein